MPQMIEKRLQCRIIKFMWNDTKSMINEETMYAPILKGGWKVLDLGARNDAIELRRCQKYYMTGNGRPRWAFVVDEIISANIKATGQVDEPSIISPHLQDLCIKPRSKEFPIPSKIAQMLKMAAKYNIIFDPPALSEELKANLPMWYHISGITTMTSAPDRGGSRPHNTNWNNLLEAKCLWTAHTVRTVGDATAIAGILSNNDHKPRKNCKCGSCKQARENGCQNPNACMARAKKLIDQLPTKFKPDPPPVLVPHQLVDAVVGPTFGPAFNKNTVVGHLNRCFHVFGTCQKTLDTPLPNNPSIVHPFPTKIYTDGSCKNNGDADAKAGAGVWHGEDDPLNIAFKIPENIAQSNNTGELIAILLAMQRTPKDETLQLFTDSKYAINNIDTHGQALEWKGWIGVANKDIIRATMAALRNCNGLSYLIKVKGHSGNDGNNGADRLANTGADKLIPDAIDLNILEHLKIEGAKINGLPQSTLYRGIREACTEKVKQRKGTVDPLKYTRKAVNLRWGCLHTDASIWKSLRNQDIDKKA